MKEVANSDAESVEASPNPIGRKSSSYFGDLDKRSFFQGCSRVFIIRVLDRILAFARSQRTFHIVASLQPEILNEWLVEERDALVNRKLTEPEKFEDEETMLGGRPFSVDDVSTYWTRHDQFFTWWKNNVDRKAKLLKLVRDTKYSGMDEKKLQRSRYFKALLVRIDLIKAYCEPLPETASAINIPVASNFRPSPTNLYPQFLVILSKILDEGEFPCIHWEDKTSSLQDDVFRINVLQFGMDILPLFFAEMSLNMFLDQLKQYSFHVERVEGIEIEAMRVRHCLFLRERPESVDKLQSLYDAQSALMHASSFKAAENVDKSGAGTESGSVATVNLVSTAASPLLSCPPPQPASTTQPLPIPPPAAVGPTSFPTGESSATHTHPLAAAGAPPSLPFLSSQMAPWQVAQAQMQVQLQLQLQLQQQICAVMQGLAAGQRLGALSPHVDSSINVSRNGREEREGTAEARPAHLSTGFPLPAPPPPPPPSLLGGLPGLYPASLPPWPALGGGMGGGGGFAGLPPAALSSALFGGAAASLPPPHPSLLSPSFLSPLMMMMGGTASAPQLPSLASLSAVRLPPPPAAPVFASSQRFSSHTVTTDSQTPAASTAAPSPLPPLSNLDPHPPHLPPLAGGGVASPPGPAMNLAVSPLDAEYMFLGQTPLLTATGRGAAPPGGLSAQPPVGMGGKRGRKKKRLDGE